VDTAERANPLEPAVGSAKPTTPESKEQRRVRVRNVVLFLLDTGTFMVALSLVDLTSVMPSLIDHLTRLPVFLGLLGAIQSACWLLPQLFVARLVAAQRRKLPVVLISTGISRLSWAILLVALLFDGRTSPSLTLAALYLSVGGFFLMDGVATLGWYDVIARAVPPTLRGRLFGLMSLSGIFALGGGLVVQRVLGNPSLPFPADYRLLVAGALILLGVGIIPLSMVVEPAGEATAAPEPFGSYLRRLPRLLKEMPSFGRLIGVQLLVGTAAMAVPFYAPYGVAGLGLPEATVGTFVIGGTLGSMLGGLSWGFLGDHGRKDLAVRALAGCALLAPVLPLGLREVGPALPPVAITVGLTGSLFFVGCSSRSGWVAYANYVIELARPSERPVLIGLMNTLSGLLAIGPPLGGLIAGWLGFEAAFLTAALFAAGGFVLSWGLVRPVGRG
jgi:MFS family permease